MSQTPYEYVRISEGLLQRMTGLLRQGNSFGLLGPRNAGKQYVLRRLCDLCRPFAATIGVVPFLTARAEEGVRSDCDQDMYLSSATLLPSGVAATLRWTDDRLGETGPGRPVVLLVANADTLPYESMVRLLEGLRERAGRAGSAGRLAAVLTGELVLRRYLRQQEAGRWWDVCFTLLGYERPEFEAFARRYVATLGLTVDVGEGVWDDLYERAGGSVYVLRLLLWTAFDRWASEEGRELRLSDLPDRVGAGQVPWNHYLRYLTRVITLDSKTWARLEVLIRGGTVEAVDDGPDDLELAGLAVRDGGVLRLGWTVLHQSLGNYFTPRRFADLYAGGGWWRKAFGRYRDLGPRERIWPSALDDVADAENAVKDLCMSLYQVAATPKDPVPASQAAPGEATAPSRPESPEETLTADEAAVEGAARVCRRFVNGCLYVLGFPEVSFWAWREGRWVRTGRSPEGLAEEPEEWYQALLAGFEPAEQARVLPVPEPLRLGVLAGAVCPRRSDEPEVVIVGGPQPPPPLWRYRWRLSDRLLVDFLTAHRHALETEREREDLHRRRQYAEIVHGILASVGTEILNVGETLAVSGRGLLEKVGYRRVLFCLIDPAGEHLEPVWEGPEHLGGLLKQHTPPYRLTDEAEQAIQVQVARSGEPYRSRDFRTDPRANQKAAEGADLRGGAFVPIRTERRVLGTVLIERQDRVWPTQEEMDALQEFAAKLAVAIDQSERVNLLQGALEQQREPVILLDWQRRIRYANQRAARFGVPPGWAPPDRLARAVMNKESGLVARWEDAAASDSSNVLSRVGKWFRRPGMSAAGWSATSSSSTTAKTSS